MVIPLQCTSNVFVRKALSLISTPYIPCIYTNFCSLPEILSKDRKSRILDPKRRFFDFRLTFSANSNPNSVSYKNYKNHETLEANLRQLSEPPARQNRLSPYPWDYQLIYIKLMYHAYNQWPVSARTMIFL